MSSVCFFCRYPASHSTGARLHHGTNYTVTGRHHGLPVSGRKLPPLLQRLSGRPTSESVRSIRRSACHLHSARCAKSTEEAWSPVHIGAIQVTQWDASVDHLRQERRGAVAINYVGVTSFSVSGFRVALRHSGFRRDSPPHVHSFRASGLRRGLPPHEH